MCMAICLGTKDYGTLYLNALCPESRYVFGY